MQSVLGAPLMRHPLAAFVVRYRQRFVILIPVLIAGALLENLTIAALYPLLSSALEIDAEAQGGPVLRALYAPIAAFPPDVRVLVAIAAFLAIVPLSVGSKFIREWSMARASAHVTYDVKQRVFERMLLAPYLFFVARRSTDFIYRLSTAPLNLAWAIVLLATVASLIATSAVTVLLLVSIEWRVTALIIVLGVVYFRLSRWIAHTFSVRAGRDQQSSQSAQLALIQDFVFGVKEITVAGTTAVWGTRFASEGATYRQAYIRERTASVVPGLLLELFVFMSAGIVVGALRIFAPEALLALLPLIAVYAYAMRQLLGFVASIGRHALGLAAVTPDIELLDQALVEIYPSVREGHRTDLPAWSAVSFESVSFRYPTAPVDALCGVDLVIPARGLTAIVGRSGAGKTSLLYLLLRMFDPTEGRLLLDGIDIAMWQRRAWLDRLGYVSQEPFVYRASVAENIRFGRDLSLEAVQDAARAAHADEFVRDLPEGYRTILADRGLSLSAGQRQRLALARAIAPQPRLLLLDEVTSALDAVSEQLVQETLAELAQRISIVMVAHRLAPVRHADRIVVLDRGRVIEEGKHAELMQRDGVYASLVTSASGG